VTATRPHHRTLRQIVRYVYVIAGPNGLYKIGQSGDPEARRKSLARLRVGLGVAAAFRADGRATYWEFFLHGAFAHRRVWREWFKLEPDDLVLIHQLWGRTMGKTRPCSLVRLYRRNKADGFRWGRLDLATRETFFFLERA
jgi:hypothetical protein